MKCPICHAALAADNPQQTSLHCPNQHGVLVSGGTLLDTNDSTAEAAAGSDKTAAPDPKRHLTCPHCGQPMSQLNYNNSGIIIDTCLKCPYRWLDQGELGKIQHRTDNLKPMGFVDPASIASFGPTNPVAESPEQKSLLDQITNSQPSHIWLFVILILFVIVAAYIYHSLPQS